MLKWIEVDSKALLHNLSLIRSLVKKKSKVIFVVKANAYGHGIEQVVKITEKSNLVDWYGVNSIEEAIKLRKLGVKKEILILGYVERGLIEEGIKNNVRFTVYEPSYIFELDKKAKKIKKKAYFHLKLETGTGRQGIEKKDWKFFKKVLKKIEYAKFEAVSSHFANIEDTTDHSYAEYQLKRFNSFCKLIKNDGFSPLKHFSCSASTLLFPKTHLDFVRVGISAYGYWPSKETHLSFLLKYKNELELKRVLSFYTKVAQIKTLKKGSFISYGLTYKTTQKTKIAVLPVGYFDGIDRKLSNTGYFLIKGERVPIRGRVCMNIVLVDVSHIKSVNSEEKVTLIGRDGKEIISADDWAEKIGTINYEIISRLSPEIPRIVK